MTVPGLNSFVNLMPWMSGVLLQSAVASTCMLARPVIHQYKLEACYLVALLVFCCCMYILVVLSLALQGALCGVMQVLLHCMLINTVSKAVVH